MTPTNDSQPQSKLPYSPKAICFLSGKGGAGKTSVSLALASLLSELGKRVLFIDWDLNTHGASYFFTDTIESQAKRGILETMQEARSPELYPLGSSWFETVTVEISQHFHFIPSKTRFKNRTWEISEDDIAVSQFVFNMMHALSEMSYDFIICDTQAGPVRSVQDLAEICGKAVIVSEPDPISIAASKNLDYEMRDHLSPTAKFLINKLSTEEVKSFRAIRQYLTVFEHLSPLPFDFSVREAFSLRRIPVDLTKPTPFLFSMLGFVGEVYPQVRSECDVLENKLKRRLLGDIELKRNQNAEIEERLSYRLKELEEEQIQYERLVRQRTAILTSAMIAMTTVTFAAFFIVKKEWPPVITQSAVILGTVASVAPILWERLRSKFTSRTRRIQSEVEQIRDELLRLRDQRDRYEAMLVETAQKYMLESKE
ncbi:MAG TPA: AAA family ATPase [Verrucomicrobiae bacterium]|nr:AAA family ATPase [Verrucomicrobiae bacterium]